jgi:hypothetical protein
MGRLARGREGDGDDAKDGHPLREGEEGGRCGNGTFI